MRKKALENFDAPMPVQRSPGERQVRELPSEDHGVSVSGGAASAGIKQSETAGMLQGPLLTPAELNRLRVRKFRKRLKSDPVRYDAHLLKERERKARKRDG